jgi:hypothetical protein
MKKYEITFKAIYPETPLTFWVHVKKSESGSFDINNFEPPLSKVIGGKGFPELNVNFLGVELRFSSLHEVSHFISVMEKRNLPTTISLSLKRNSGVGPNGHWLSRLPSCLKPWKQRVQLVKLLKTAKAEFTKVCLNQ